MERAPKLLLLLVFVVGATALAQSDGQPASSNIAGQDYPKIDSDLRATFRIRAPGVQRMQLDLGRRYDMVKGDDGVWTVTTEPLVPGFHYYSLMIDGYAVADPASESFFGTGRMSSGIEVPSPGEDFYEIKDVPHGEVRQRRYYSDVTKAWRRCFVYTPPGYDQDTDTRYPVLYLNHGGGEDERSWVVQGRVDIILDNLIAAGKAKPMIVVVPNGEARAPGEQPTRYGAETLTKVVIDELIPMIDSTYRTLADRDNRAMAGLSLGGLRTAIITLNNLDKFAWIGGFSGSGSGPNPRTIDIQNEYGGVLADAEAFNARVHLFWIGIGTAERQAYYDSTKGFSDQMRAAGIDTVYVESPGTAHEWLTWRRALADFAPRLFKN